jgi:hypothetical protein
MEMLLFTVLGIVLYVVSDRLLVALEKVRAGRHTLNARLHSSLAR